WGDSFNVATEFVAATSARILATYACVMAQTSLETQAWRTCAAEIKVSQGSEIKKMVANLSVPGMDLSQARILWEAREQEPAYGTNFSLSPRSSGKQWVEFEAQWPDGRRIAGATNFVAREAK